MQLDIELLFQNVFHEKLISEYNALKLFKAQDIDPWKLITNPTLIPNPIAPKRINLFVSFSMWLD